MRKIILIVLGCRLKGTQPSEMLRRRLEKAYELLKSDNTRRCIVSGGQGDDEAISEAQAMKNYLTAKGIDEQRIIKEDKSRNTKQNIEFSKKIIDNKKLSKNVIIVTDRFHQFRACYYARSVNLIPVKAICKTRIRSLPYYYIREILAIIKAFLGF